MENVSQICSKSDYFKASEALHFSAVTEANFGVIGHEVRPLETIQDFTKNGTAVKGGSAAARTWTDKSYVPITLKTQCVDCLHCVVACPHLAIGHTIEQRTVSRLTTVGRNFFSAITGTTLDKQGTENTVSKGETNYSNCKGCFVCGSACPTGAIHFVPKDLVNYDVFQGAPVEPENIDSIFLQPEVNDTTHISKLIQASRGANEEHTIVDVKEERSGTILNGSQVLAMFTFQAKFECATLFPITPNTGYLKCLEARIQKDPHTGLELRTCLSEESGYAWLTGAAVRGKRAVMAQGSQSMAQLFEFLNINPGLHLPIFMFELTRALSPGTSIKPDHTATLRTADTGEIIIFGRSIQDNYDKSLLLLKLMESDGVWVSGRLVVKGFVETHALSTQRQTNFQKLSDEEVTTFLGKPQNPFVFTDKGPVSVGILDLDGRYAEQRQAIDTIIKKAGEVFNDVASELSSYTKRPPLKKITLYPENRQSELLLISLNDPDMETAEFVADQLNTQGISAGVLSVNLYRPFPAEEIRNAASGAKACAILDYSNGAGRSNSQFSDEIKAALYSHHESPEIVTYQVGLGGRAVTVPYFLYIYRVLHDLAHENKSTLQWIEQNCTNGSLSIGARGENIIPTQANFDIPVNQPEIEQMVVVGRGGQGLLLLNSFITGAAVLRDQSAVSMVGYGALQRGGGITLSVKYGNTKIRDYSDIVMCNTIVSFNDDLHLETMLPQLLPGGTLILAGDKQSEERYRSMVAEGVTIIIIPARELATGIYSNDSRTNIIMLGAILGHMGVENVSTLLTLADTFPTLQEIKGEAKLLNSSDNRTALIAGYLAYKKIDLKDLPHEDIDLHIETPEHFRQRILPDNFIKAFKSPAEMASLKKRYAVKKKLYQFMFDFHPMVNEIRAMYSKLGGRSPVSAGDMACPGCGQINIFRNVFNYLEYLQDKKGKIFISEQDGCGTVFSGLNRTSIWNTPYIRIAFETAHGVASGLTHNSSPDDLVVSVAGDGGFFQGIRSVEDSLHQQDPIFHLVVINETLGNTGGQSTVTTFTGSRTKEGHIARQEGLNFLRYCEKYSVQGAVASTVHMHDLMEKLQWGYNVVKKERKPFMLLMNFTCLEQGANLAKSLSIQKKALDAHHFNLYSLKYKKIHNSKGQLLYTEKQINIDWYPLVFGKHSWKKHILEFAKEQKTMKKVVTDPELLEIVYGQTRGQWIRLKKEMGTFRYYWGFVKNLFSISRFTMMRLIKHTPPKEAQ